LITEQVGPLPLELHCQTGGKFEPQSADVLRGRLLVADGRNRCSPRRNCGLRKLRYTGPMKTYVFALCLFVVVGAAHAQSARLAPPPLGEANPADIAAVQTCTARANDYAALDACADVVGQSCMREPGAETTVGMISCGMRSRGAWDVALNTAYAAQMKSETRGQRSTLQRAQRAWIAWRDAGCAYEASAMEGGSLARVIEAECLARKTAARAIELLARQRGPEFH
jgi:uncharacterized protein YecT (DUF1311 family)